MLDSFNYTKKGYDPYEVDAYIEKLEEVLKAYKEKDHAINNAIVSAQMAADNIVREASIKASQIVSDAQVRLSQMENLLTMQKNIVDSFTKDYSELVHKYLSNLNENDMFKVYAKINSLEEKINSLKSVHIDSQILPPIENKNEADSNPVE